MASNSNTLPPNFDPETAGNLEDIEKQFAVKVVQHMQTYWSLLESQRGSELRLTRYDDEIYAEFLQDFPDYTLSCIDENIIKSKQGKEAWRTYIAKFEKRIPDFNFGTLLRTHSNQEYSQDNSTFVVRMQFYAIEIARNRAGLNDWAYEAATKRSTKQGKSSA